MTPQETFDFICRALIAQGGPSVDRSTGGVICKYRYVMPDGSVRKCAGGMVIPDCKYDPNFEGVALYAFKPSSPTILQDRLHDIVMATGHNMSVVTVLQSYHDAEVHHNDLAWLRGFAVRARAQGLSRGLDTSVLDEVLPPESPVLEP